MSRSARCLVGMLILAVSWGAQASISLSSDTETITTRVRSIEEHYVESMRDERLGLNFASTFNLREKRKVGAGVSVGGALGFVGFNMELNFEESQGVLAGFGTGPGFNSIQISWKQAFDGDFLAPYTSVGYSRWYNSHGNSDDYKKSGILDRVLTEEEKRTGQFGSDFVHAALGLQYNQLSGELSGVSLFGEIMAMLEVKRAVLLPTGTVGALYYF